MASESRRIDFDFDKPKDPPTPHFANGINGEEPKPKNGDIHPEAVKKAAGPGRAKGVD